VVAVSAAALVAIPHWSAIFFIAPLVIVLYIDLLGGKSSLLTIQDRFVGVLTNLYLEMLV